MPNVLLGIPTTYESVSRPVVNSVVADIIEMTGIPKDIAINYPGSNGKIVEFGSALGDLTPVVFDKGKSKFFVTSSETYYDDSSFSTASKEAVNLPIFRYAPLGISAYPVYSDTTLTLTIALRCSTQAEAIGWVDQLRASLKAGAIQLVHELEYHYEIPKSMIMVLHHIHHLKETQGGYGTTFGNWMRECLSSKATALTTIVGTKPTLVIKEVAGRVIGGFDFIEPPQPEKDSDGYSWNVGFTYSLRYQKPVQINFVYPIVVHNQLIDDRFYETEPLMVIRPDNQVYKETQTKLLEATSAMFKPSYRNPYIHRYPVYDEWLADMVPHGYAGLYTWLTGISQDNLVDLMSISEWDTGYLLPDIKSFLLKELPYLTTPGESVFNISVYENDLALHPDSFTIDDQLYIRSNSNLDIRKTYHIRLNVSVDFTRLSDRAIMAMRENPDATFIILDTLIPGVDKTQFYAELLKGTYVKNSYMTDITRLLYERYTMQGVYGNKTGGIHLLQEDKHDFVLVNRLTIIGVKDAS